MRKAIDSSRQLQQQIEEKTFAFGGPFSKRKEMISAGLAEDSEERFADSMGYNVFARILKKTSSIEQRRNLYYAASAKFCLEPSLKENFPEKAQIEKEYSLEPHSMGKKRRTEILIAPIRAALGCTKDFNQKECSL